MTGSLKANNINDRNDITQESLGAILKKKRLSLNIEIKDICANLKIKARDIEAIENNNFETLGGHVYLHGIISSYAKLLKIDDKILAEKIKILPVVSNLKNPKHKLVNIGENIDLTPDKDMFFNFLLVSVLIFFVLLTIFNSAHSKKKLIKNSTLIEHFEKKEEIEVIENDQATPEKPVEVNQSVPVIASPESLLTR